MAAAAGLSVTLVPVLMGYWIRGKLPFKDVIPYWIAQLLAGVVAALGGVALGWACHPRPGVV